MMYVLVLPLIFLLPILYLSGTPINVDFILKINQTIAPTIVAVLIYMATRLHFESKWQKSNRKLNNSPILRDICYAVSGLVVGICIFAAIARYNQNINSTEATVGLFALSYTLYARTVIDGIIP